MVIDVEGILEFWYADSKESDESFLRRIELWFSVSDSFDLLVKEKYQTIVESVAEGDGSQLESEPRGILALIIAMDQLPRNIYRGSPKAFAYDHEALRLARKVLDAGMDHSMGYLEKLFAYMPLQHSENIDVQDLSVNMFGSMIEDARTKTQSENALESLRYAEMHRDIIKRFGRFPHRNEILGRESTSEEVRFLASGAENFGQIKT